MSCDEVMQSKCGEIGRIDEVIAHKKPTYLEVDVSQDTLGSAIMTQFPFVSLTHLNTEAIVFNTGE